MDTLFQEIRHAVRSLRRSPGFTLAAVTTLALGIGANTAVFSVVRGVLLRPPPFAEPERLAMVWETDRKGGTTREPASIPDFRDMAERTHRFAQLAAFSPAEVNVTSGSGDPERLAALTVTANYFATIGLGPIAGRAFTAGEDLAGGPRAVVIGEDLWDRVFQRDPSAMGRTLRINDLEWTVVGVMPRGADFGTLQVLGAAAYMRGFADRGGRARVDLWLPLRASPAAPRSNHPIFLLGRLAPGATTAAAQEEMAAIAADLERAYPQDNADRGAHVERLDAVIFGNVQAAMYLMVGAVWLVFLVACVNVANLMLARGTARAREVTVRAALGAGAARLVRQFLVEGAVLVGSATLVGVALAWAATRALAVSAPATLPRAGDIRVDATVLAATMVISVAVAVAFGMLPALQARRVNLHAALHGAGGRGASHGRGQRRARSVLVAAELAMATMLMVGAGLLIRSIWTLQAVDPGFDARGVIKAEFQLPASRYPQDFARWPRLPERQRFQDAVLAGLEGQPGVASAALATANPMDAGFTSSIRVVGREAEAAGWPEPSIRTVSNGYFGTLRVPVTAGRGFAATDAVDAAPVAIINESARERYYGAREPLGTAINLWGANRTVVGVVGNERLHGLAVDAPPAVYLPLAQAPIPNTVLVRMSGDAAAGAPLVRRVLRGVDPQLAVFGVEPLEDTVRGTLAQRRFVMLVLAAFAVAALALAAVGVHGVLGYAVAQRTREIGIRVALGADVAGVRRLVVRDGMRLAAAGVALGLAGALVLSRLIATLLFGVNARDPATFVAVAGVLGAVALAACVAPAARATCVDPMTALRAE
ncbi:MAG: ABC transporter permease [Gemmatimonadota bacterium]|nr:ABC transporter permease [Gemmatimonadota bacterium]